MTLDNPQKQRNYTIFKAATVDSGSLWISTFTFQPILWQGPSADTMKYLSQCFPSQSFN